MINEIHSDANSRMDKSLSSLENDFSKIRAGRAHPSLLEQVTVEYYGAIVPLSQVSNISAEDSRTLKVSPWEKDMVGPIEKAILTSDLGLNPNTQGQVMRIPLPPLTEERRKELAFEGHRYLDLKRLKSVTNVGISRDAIDCVGGGSCLLPVNDFRFTLPIPQSEINAQPSLQQNPDY